MNALYVIRNRSAECRGWLSSDPARLAAGSESWTSDPTGAESFTAEQVCDLRLYRLGKPVKITDHVPEAQQCDRSTKSKTT